MAEPFDRVGQGIVFDGIDFFWNGAYAMAIDYMAQNLEGWLTKLAFTRIDNDAILLEPLEHSV